MGGCFVIPSDLCQMFGMTKKNEYKQDLTVCPKFEHWQKHIGPFTQHVKFYSHIQLAF